MNQPRALYKPVSVATMLTTSCILVIFVSGVLVSGSPVGLADGPLEPDKGEKTNSQTDNNVNALLSRLFRSVHHQSYGTNGRGQTLLSRLARSSLHHDHRTSSGQHLLDHILHEVQKGHVSSLQMHHWHEQINHALAEGTLTQAQVDAFLVQLHMDMTHVSGDSGCYDNRMFDDAFRLYRRLARHGPPSENILDHILHEVRKGHVTGAALDHWRNEITRAVREGSLTSQDVDEFLQEFKSLAPGSMTDWCCIFG